MLKELANYLTAWPLYVLAFIAVGIVIIKCGEFIGAFLEWLRDKHRRNKP